MGKVFGILLIVLGVWIGMEIFTNGTQGAFGGALASIAGDGPGAPSDPPVQRIRERVTKDLAAGLARSGVRADEDAGDEPESDSFWGDEPEGDDW